MDKSFFVTIPAEVYKHIHITIFHKLYQPKIKPGQNEFHLNWHWRSFSAKNLDVVRNSWITRPPYIVDGNALESPNVILPYQFYIIPGFHEIIMRTFF